MSFLPANYQLAMLFHSRLAVRHGTDRQTDRQTDDGHKRFMPTLRGRGQNDVRRAQSTCITAVTATRAH